MLFNSPLYIFLFLPFVVVIYYLLNKYAYYQQGKFWLVLASLFFYAYWKFAYLFIIMGSVCVNYILGYELTSRHFRAKLKHGYKLSNKILLTVGIAINLGLLLYYKYADFFLSNLNLVTGSHFSLLHLALPLAISFFTFQQIAYLCDCFRNNRTSYTFLDYCLFVTFFPQLIAGPIVHHWEILPQFARNELNRLNWNHILVGCYLFFIGLFKKLVVADSFANWANIGFSHAQNLSTLDAWASSLSYTFQLYFDFSGYSDMAIGAALLFNIHLPTNFFSPYKSRNIQEFWRRWHITLSHWLRDYIYIPLGGSKTGRYRTYINLLTTFLLGGLWHGAGWSFVIWGALHGLALCIHRFWSRLGFIIPKLLAIGITFMFVNITWVFFRADNTQTALLIINKMFDFSSLHLSTTASILLSFLFQTPPKAINSADTIQYMPEFTLIICTLTFLTVLTIKNSMQIKESLLSAHQLQWRTLSAFAILTAISLWFLVATSTHVFLYFNF